MSNKIFVGLVCVILGIGIGVGLFYITDTHKPVVENKKTIENYLDLELKENNTSKIKDISTSPTAVEINSLEAGTVVDENMIDFNNISAYFTVQPFDNQNDIPSDKLDYVRVLHYGIDNNIYTGEIVVNKAISKDISEIFTELFNNKYPIGKMKLADKYENINSAVADNNTFGFYYDVAKSVNHSIGMAVDINPIYNPLVADKQGVELVYPAEGREYADRNKDFPCKINKNDLCFKLFINHGFVWGGDNNDKDYKHFEKEG